MDTVPGGGMLTSSSFRFFLLFASSVEEDSCLMPGDDLAALLARFFSGLLAWLLCGDEPFPSDAELAWFVLSRVSSNCSTHIGTAARHNDVGQTVVPRHTATGTPRP